MSRGDRRFDGRSCIVTGGGRGIGRSIALALGAEGATVAVVARSREQCEQVAGEMDGRGVALVADVTDAGSCERMVAEFVGRAGRPSVLVNAAGIAPVRERAETHDLDAFRSVVETNLIGAFTMTRAAAPLLLDGGGAVVNVASVLGIVASPRLAPYGAAKGGLIQLTRTLAREWADRGVRVNAVCPGYVETEMTRALLAVDHLRQEILDRTALGRLATLAEVVGPTLFLASDEASYVTGAALVVDGGLSI